MKKRNRILAIALAAAITAIMMISLTASAAGPGSITINAPANLVLNNQTFLAYKIFDATIKQDDLGVYDPDKIAYTLTTDFAGFQTDPAYNSVLGTLTLYQYLTSTTVTREMDKLSEALWRYISDKSIPATGSEPAGDGTPAGTPVKTVTIDNLPLGYYLVYGMGVAADPGPDGGTVVASCALTTTVPEVEIDLKADAPTIDKLIWNQHEDIQDWVRWTDVSIGDIVTFRHESAVPYMIGYTSYTFTVHDIMSPGLTFRNDVEIWLGDKAPWDGGADVPSNKLVAGVDYNVAFPPVPADGCTFNIVFEPTKFVTYTAEKPIYIYYTAILNEEAIIGVPGNPNEAMLEYSRTPYEAGTGEETTNKTPWRRVKVYTGEFGFIKVDGEEQVLSTLPDAIFELRTDPSDPNTAIFFIETVSTDGSVNTYRKATQAEISAGLATKNLTTPKDGYVKLRGLGASYRIEDSNGVTIDYDDFGDYWLVETKAPDGFIKIEYPIPVELRIDCVYDGLIPDQLDATTWVLVEDRNLEDPNNNNIDWVIVQGGDVRIKNYSGAQFPDTGGSGRRMFIIGGVALMGLAVIGLVAVTARKKRKILTD